MSVKTRPWILPLATAAVLLTSTAPAFADTVEPAPVPIGPNQTFVGVVNGATANADVKTDCIGPVHVGQMGHPLPSQPILVRQLTGPVTHLSGFTGTAADRVYAGFGITAGVATPIEIDFYGVATKIPTNLLVPCYGPGAVTFTPYLTSPTARAATVSVTFVSEP